MAHDRFVYFEKRSPTSKEVETILDNFFNGVGTVSQDGNRWTVQLPGKPRAAIEGIDDAHPTAVRDDERWIEVYQQRGEAPYVDVITRAQDEFTTSLFGGRVEDD